MENPEEMLKEIVQMISAESTASTNGGRQKRPDKTPAAKTRFRDERREGPE